MVIGIDDAAALVSLTLGGIALGKMAYQAGSAAAPKIGRSVNRLLHAGKPKSANKFMANQRNPKPAYVNFMSKKGKESLQHVSQRRGQTAGQALNAIHGGAAAPSRTQMIAAANLSPYINQMGARSSQRPTSFNQSIEHLNQGRATDGLDAYNRTFYGNRN